MFFFLHLEQWENLLHVRVCSAYMVLWENMMLSNIKTQPCRIILNMLGFSFHDFMSLSQINICKEYMYVEEKSFGLFFFQRRNQH